MLKRKAREREEHRAQVNKCLLEKLNVETNLQEKFLNYFSNEKIGTVAIYGAGAVGEKLCEHLKKCTNIELKYIIDKFDGRDNIAGIKLLQLRFDFLPEVDAVIITPCHEKEFILFELGNYYTDSCRMIMLDDLLKGVNANDEA